MIKKIYLITNYNLYESKYYFATKFSEACQRKGIHVVKFDASNPQKPELSPIECDFSCSFNSAIPTPGGQFFYDVTKSPHWSILLDPYYYYRQFLNSPYSILSCVDLWDCRYLRSPQFQNVFFWPHAVERDLAPAENQERPYEVTFLGSCYDHETLREFWQTHLAKKVCQVIDDAIEIDISDNKTHIMQALLQALEKNKMSPDEVPLEKMFTYVDNYVRGRDRVELIKSIKNARVHVFGATCWRDEQPLYGWSQSLKGLKNVTIHPSVPYPESLEIMKQSKISLNSMPFFKNGSHERIFTSLACGSLPVTSDNLWVRENFANGKELVIYPPMGWEYANDRIDYYLAHDKEREEVIQAGRAKVMREHTWDNRVDLMLQELPPILARIKGASQKEGAPQNP